MQQVAAARGVRQAVRMLKHMSVQAPEWDEYREAGRAALARVLQERMHGFGRQPHRRSAGDRGAGSRAAGPTAPRRCSGPVRGASTGSIG